MKFATSMLAEQTMDIAAMLGSMMDGVKAVIAVLMGSLVYGGLLEVITEKSACYCNASKSLA
ncbi:hypothetical protein [methanotrophic endosymbiont of Bathymodiolus puteoserpentis (Logatchev)]|uniref:hypothetical protein n=1 Tax=methanotrophic endosymbiont of Bathymodiolus puteoserpentis (Logatchev) TaxID=343235 RepID=UPI001C2CE652|nr:hypothetical protein [methanotrophic endosymbiont of Bathymodiolus puteoserpentis (Logatchev)]